MKKIKTLHLWILIFTISLIACDSDTSIGTTDRNIEIIVGNGGTASGAGTYCYGENIALTAQPNTSYMFDGWYDEDGILISQITPYILSVANSRTIEARFKLKAIVVSCVTEGDGKINGTGEYEYGSDIILRAEPTLHTIFKGWYNEKGILVSESKIYSIDNVTSDVNFKAEFLYKVYFAAYLNFGLNPTYTGCSAKRNYSSGIAVLNIKAYVIEQGKQIPVSFKTSTLTITYNIKLKGVWRTNNGTWYCSYDPYHELTNQKIYLNNGKTGESITIPSPLYNIEFYWYDYFNMSLSSDSSLQGNPYVINKTLEIGIGESKYYENWQ